MGQLVTDAYGNTYDDGSGYLDIYSDINSDPILTQLNTYTPNYLTYPAAVTGGTVPTQAQNTAGNSSLTALTNAAVARLSVPQLNPGQSLTYNPITGQLIQATQQPAGFAATGASLTTGLGLTGSLPLLLLGGVALFAFMGKK